MQPIEHDNQYDIHLRLTAYDKRVFKAICNYYTCSYSQMLHDALWLMIVNNPRLCAIAERATGKAVDEKKKYYIKHNNKNNIDDLMNEIYEETRKMREKVETDTE